MQAWGTIGTYEAREEANPIPQDSSPLNGDYSVGVLVATVIHNGPKAGVYFPFYDGNENVMGYVRGADGLLAAQYEYGPFGELLRATGPLSQNFNPLFSTKYHDWETGLLYYGHRYYNPSTGRWPNRDPMGEEAGMNCYSFLGNEPIRGDDYLGLWDETVDLHATLRWALKAGYPADAAQAVADADEDVDEILFSTSYIFEPGTQYHFDRSLSMDVRVDTRITKYKEHLDKAKDLCTISRGNDEPSAAAKQLGTGLHPYQDWMAHGDHNKRLLGSFSSLKDIHNAMSPAKGSKDFPDDPDLDAKGSPDGRATFSVLHFVADKSGNIRDWADYERGHQRYQLTHSMSSSALHEFREYVRANGGCKCKTYFGVE
ncbi:MAG: RHS repeat-associated core domain-containing protein, partial [Verrucomicrobiae bacterium]|nr:RHS repeat-associated core domain-containing protein [Verrucomicrobiae bacterium]